MSLGPIYVKARDGCVYANPAFRGEGWFVCWDEDEPVELVVKRGTRPPHLPWFKKVGKAQYAYRCFGKTVDVPSVPARAWFGEVKSMPVPDEHDGKWDSWKHLERSR